MRRYELMLVIRPDVADDKSQALVDRITRGVTASGGQIVKVAPWGRRRLAYPIQKFEDGVYTRFLYDSVAEVPRELERRMRISDKVLRHLTVHLEREWAVGAKEQVIKDAQAKAEAEGRLLGEEGEAPLAPLSARTAEPDLDADAELEADDVDLEERG